MICNQLNFIPLTLKEEHFVFIRVLWDDFGRLHRSYTGKLRNYKRLLTFASVIIPF
jgi:hypothetical protein